MAEFALRVTSNILRKEKYDEIQPIGAVVSGWSDRRIRRKWLEIVCDLMRPRFRYKGQRIEGKREATIANHMANSGWSAERCKAISDLWSESLWRRWFEVKEMDDSTQAEIARLQLWSGDIANVSGWVQAVGKEPHGVEDAVNTVPWSLADLKALYMVPADGLGTNEAEAVAGKRVDVVDFRQVVTPFHVVDWDAGLGLTEEEKEAIRNPKAIVFPRFDRKIPRGRIKESRPDVRAMRRELGR
jgi:hypothetical protein